MKSILFFLLGMIVGMVACYAGVVAGWIKPRWFREAEEYIERFSQEIGQRIEKLERRL